MKRFPLAFLMLTLMFSIACAQSPEFGTWNHLLVRYHHNDKLSVQCEGFLRSLRFYDQFNYYDFRLGGEYEFTKWVKANLVAGSHHGYAAGGNFNPPKTLGEFRIYPQLTLSHDVWRIRVEHRYRADLRWKNTGYRNRFRYRLGFSYSFGKETKGFKPFQVSVNDEVNLTDKAPFFQRNRVMATIRYKPVRAFALQLGVMQQLDYRIDQETNRFDSYIGLYYDIFRKSITKPKPDAGLKDI